MRSDVWHKVHRLHGQGLSAEGIARTLHMRPYKVERLLLESGALKRLYEYNVRDYRLIEDYRDGLTHREICERYGVPNSVLQKVLRVHGEQKRPRKQPLDKELVRLVSADYLDSDMTREEICSAHGITEALLNRILEEEELPRRTPPKRSRNGSWPGLP